MFLILVVGCSPSANDKDRTTYDEENRAALSKEMDGQADDAIEAKLTVERYFAMVASESYDTAWQMWDNEGKAWGGDAESLAAFYQRYESFDPEVGDPTEVKTLDGRQFVHVEVRARAKLKSNKRDIALNGRVMLQRNTEVQNGTDWFIGGMDLRGS
ncbi:hypothetical protein [Sphingorhabdus sp.]|uniref:hypothetical protein n=1 Tax=Sphingorhabdus sp. TaxID=1902408 RepID=UPI002FD9B075